MFRKPAFTDCRLCVYVLPRRLRCAATLPLRVFALPPALHCSGAPCMLGRCPTSCTIPLAASDGWRGRNLFGLICMLCKFAPRVPAARAFAPQTFTSTLHIIPRPRAACTHYWRRQLPFKVCMRRKSTPCGAAACACRSVLSGRLRCTPVHITQSHFLPRAARNHHWQRQLHFNARMLRKSAPRGVTACSCLCCLDASDAHLYFLLHYVRLPFWWFS
jgi:hypothetical protein